MMKEHYKTLGVRRNATALEIKHAYRRLIKECHPDVNPSPKAAERARALNEAYAVLSDAKARASYDMDLRTEDSGQSAGQPRKGPNANSAPGPEPSFHCERCGRLDASLRISAIWRVASGIFFFRRTSITKILCNRCRVKESLAASAYTFFLGWWSPPGFYLTIGALISNALGGDQPWENNSALLRSVSYQLYKGGRLTEAYKALSTALKLQPDFEAEKFLEQLRQAVSTEEKKPAFWKEAFSFDLHPFFYHAPVIGAGVGTLAIFIFIVLGAVSPNSPTYAQSPTETYDSQNSQYSPAIPLPSDAANLAYREPSLPQPEQGPLLVSESFENYAGPTAPLKLTTPSDGNYVMKVEDWTTKELVAMYFIGSNSTLSIELPPGSYRIKFAKGGIWHGTYYLFGPRTAYSCISDKINFYASSNIIRGYGIQLTRRLDGNLKTPPLRARDW